MNEERMRILKMIEGGQLSAEEGARLLEALDVPESEPERVTETPPEGATRSVRVRVFDSITGREKVNLAVPIGFAKMLGSLIPEAQRRQIEEHGFHMEDLLQFIESGRIGKVVDIDNKEQDEKVEISIE